MLFLQGTLDCLLCNTDGEDDVDNYLINISKALNKDGIYISITYGPEPERLQYFESRKFNWTHTSTYIQPKKEMHPKPASASELQRYSQELENPGEYYYIYVFKKDKPAEPGRELAHEVTAVLRSTVTPAQPAAAAASTSSIAPPLQHHPLSGPQ